MRKKAVISCDQFTIKIKISKEIIFKKERHADTAISDIYFLE